MSLLKPIPNPHGTQTRPAPAPAKPTPPRTPDGRFTRLFDPHPKPITR